jgi:hypothetical protein
MAADIEENNLPLGNLCRRDPYGFLDATPMASPKSANNH